MEKWSNNFRAHILFLSFGTHTHTHKKGSILSQCESVYVTLSRYVLFYPTIALHNMQCILMPLWNFKWTNGWTHITRKFQWFSVHLINHAWWLTNECVHDIISIARMLRCMCMWLSLASCACFDVEWKWIQLHSSLYLNCVLSRTFSLVFLISATKLLTITLQTWTAIRHKLRFYSAFVMFVNIDRDIYILVSIFYF